ncbi:MAG: rod shape-determining protein MreD [Gammaproteobacteria bacterium WSBS_2016_MAG_OTU1]
MSNYSSSYERTQTPYMLIVVTVFLALSLEFAPWPGWVLQVKPLFPDLALIYWVVHRPQIFNYTVAVIMGIIMDLAGQLPLGFTALVYTIMTMLSNNMRGRFSLQGPFAQAIHVLFVLSCGQAALFLLKLLEGGNWDTFGWKLFAPSATAAALWLLLPLLMQRLARLLTRDKN